MPFSTQQFLDVFRAYNESIWPAQALLFLLAILAVLGALWQKRGVVFIVAAMWVWCGVAYHWMQFTRINGAAWIFGALFIGEAALILRSRQAFNIDDVPAGRKWIGLSLIMYALAIYPVAGDAAGHIYPAAPTFGTPCPLTIFTIGMFLLAMRPLLLSVLAIPLVWSAIASTAILRFGMIEDAGLPVAAAIAIALLVMKRQPRSAPAARHPFASAPPPAASQ